MDNHTNAIDYLYRMEYTNEIAWLPENFNAYEDFEDTVGFTQYQGPERSDQGVYLILSSLLLLLSQGMIPLFKRIFICPTKIEMIRSLRLKKVIKLYSAKRF